MPWLGFGASWDVLYVPGDTFHMRAYIMFRAIASRQLPSPVPQLYVYLDNSYSDQFDLAI